jgi:hypothetical protein
MSALAILLQVTMAKHRRTSHIRLLQVAPQGRSKKLLNTIVLINPFETQQVLWNPRFLSRKACESAGCIPMKTIGRKSSKALFRKVWVVKQVANFTIRERVHQY